MNWKRTGLGCAADGGKRTILTQDQVLAAAKVEGVTRLATGRVKAGKAFASPVATYEPIRPGKKDVTRILGYDGSWAAR